MSCRNTSLRANAKQSIKATIILCTGLPRAKALAMTNRHIMDTTRHCEARRAVAIQCIQWQLFVLDCFVVTLLAMTSHVMLSAAKHLMRYRKEILRYFVPLNDDETKKKRLQILNDKVKEASLKSNQKYLGCKMEILIDSVKDGVYQGRTRNNKVVHLIDGNDYSIGQFVNAKIERVSTWCMFAKTC